MPASAASLFPLQEAFASAGLDPPEAECVRVGEIPYPHRALLVHNGSTTASLERWFGVQIAARPLQVSLADGAYLRLVLLELQGSRRPVMMSAIRLTLDGFASGVLCQILDGSLPIGRILRDAGISFNSIPRGFFRMTPNAHMQSTLTVSAREPLYGRTADLVIDGASRASVVDILAAFTNR